MILIVIAHLLWPRGTDLGLRVRSRRMLRSCKRPTAGDRRPRRGRDGRDRRLRLSQHQAAQPLRDPDDIEKYQADYEKKYLKYEKLPQPSIAHVKLDVQLFPQQRRLIALGAYDLVNNTSAPIRDVHIRQGDRTPRSDRLELSGAKLVSYDKRFNYRIFRFDKPLAPGAHATLAFASQLWRRGFRAGSPATDVIENGTFANNFDFAPIIGMNRRNSAQRPRQAPPAGPAARAADGEARGHVGDRPQLYRQRLDHVGHHADHRRRPNADRTGQPRLRRHGNGRRTAHFVSDAPILNFFSIQSADYRVAKRDPQRPPARSLLQPGSRLERRQDADRHGDRARLLPRALRALSVQLRPDRRIPRLQQLRPGLRRDDALFGIDRLQRQHQRTRPRSTGRPMSSRTKWRTNIGRTR